MSASASTSESAQELAVRFLDAGSSSDADAAPSSSPIAKQLAAMIASRQAHLLEVVKASAGHLTSEDDKKRGRGIGLLAHVVIRCPKEAVKRQEGKTLSEFFISSLSSPVSEDVLVPALEGLAALAKLPSFGATEAQTVAKTIFANVDLHGRPQTTRYFCYCLFDVLLAYQRAALKKMGKPFLTGYCALVTGEKDPRNLRLAFSIAKILILEFDIADNVQELFDITFCYFPITFTPPPNDPYGITSEQLQGSLRDCLSATPRFGPLALPLFLEKLQATSNTAKKQTLQAFVAAFPVYGKAVVTPDAVTIWEAISMEIYHASDSEMEEHALKALKALLETLYPDGTEEAVSHDATKSVARRLSDACLLELKDSNKSNAKPASRILARAISASGMLARYLVPKAFGQLLHIYKVPDEIQQRPALFIVMARLLEQLRECPVANTAEPFLDFREEVLSLCTSSLALSTTGSQALDCLVQLVQLPGCLDGDELVFALQSITSLLVSVGSPDVGEDASAAALDGLASVSQLFPKRIEETVLPSLFGRLPDRAPSINDHPAIASYRLALACLATLCVLPELFEVLLIRLLSRLESTCNFKTEEPAQHAQNTLYAHHLLTTLRVVLEKKIAAGHKDVAIRATSITSRLYGLFIPPTLTNEEIRTAATEPRILEDAGRILMLLVQQLDEKAQRDLNTALRLAYFENKPTGLLGGSPKKASERSLTPFGPGASTSQINLVLLYAFPLYAVRKEVFDSPQDLSRLCETLLVEALPRWSGARPFEPSCKLLASLLNKRADSLPDFVDVTLPAFWDERIGTVMADSNSRKAALTVWAWSMRGLIVRSDNRAYDGVAKLVSLFADEGLSKAAARTMAILSKDNDAVLTKENGAVIRLLYKQRFFSFILPKLVHGYHAASTDASKATPYLVGLSCLLQSMPKQTIITELPKLLPLLMRALELPELDLRAHVIDTLALLVRDTPDAVKHQASTLVGLLLKNATCTDPARDSEAFVQLRVSALGCLTVFPDTIDWLALHQQKAPVLKALGAIVDDRKKRVRKEAVDCRTRWFLFKAP